MTYVVCVSKGRRRKRKRKKNQRKRRRSVFCSSQPVLSVRHSDGSVVDVTTGTTVLLLYGHLEKEVHGREL